MAGTRLELAVLVLGMLTRSSNGFGVTIDAHEEQCFHDNVKVGTKIAMAFQVAEGGFLDIDVKITGPDDKVIFSGERETDGKYTFNAHMDGVYQYCFSNKMSTMTPKLVVFKISVSSQEDTPDDSKEVGEDKHSRLKEMIGGLSEAVYNIKREQALMEVRDHTHKQINESTNSRVVWWSFFEAVVLVVMSVGQVYYLNRFFEVRTTV